MKKAKLTNALVAVTRHFSGEHIGKDRFSAIDDVVKKVIKLAKK